MGSRLFGDVIEEVLRRHYNINPEEFVAMKLKDSSLFEIIIGTVLSQNTSDRNSLKAFNNLRRAFGKLEPRKIAGSGRHSIEELIRPAGLYRNRARVIIELAEVFSREGFEEHLAKTIAELPAEPARRLLMELPGIGEKTADVVLLMYFNKPVFPIDTHIRRISRRLGVVSSASYNAISRYWIENASPHNYLSLHLLLIVHGRRTCKARNPRCSTCPISIYCNYARVNRLVEEGTST